MGGGPLPRPYDAHCLRPQSRFLGGGPLFETSRCQFVKAGKLIFWVGDHFRDLTMPIFEGPKTDFWVGDHLSRPHDANLLRPKNISCVRMSSVMESRRCDTVCEFRPNKTPLVPIPVGRSRKGQAGLLLPSFVCLSLNWRCAVPNEVRVSPSSVTVVRKLGSILNQTEGGPGKFLVSTDWIRLESARARERRIHRMRNHFWWTEPTSEVHLH